ncbi:reverse transcriptase-like protein [Elysia marginata]|uniref:Reverse transcriptase-like protein n=1 Tax=Elysia marginata TaxID=1093978 RepID=A0AAV4JDV9_9GAST|nr:reverse transcriptase-like protein [Elysia marginata]
MPTKVLIHINRMFFRFIWKKKSCNKRAFEKVKRKTVCNETKNGGLKMFNIVDIQSAAYIHWAEALLTGEEEEWKKWARQALKPLGAEAAFLCTNEKVRGLDKKNLILEKKVTTTWVELNDNNEHQDFYNQPLFDNKHLAYNDNSLYIKQCIDKNIIYVKDVLQGNNFISLEQYVLQTGPYPGSQMDYNLLRSVVLREKKKRAVLTSAGAETRVLFKGQKLGKLKRKGILKLITPVEKPLTLNLWKKKIQ